MTATPVGTTSRWRVAAYMALNNCSSIAIVVANKFAFQTGFNWPVTLTTIHFLFTFVGLELCARNGFFTPKSLTPRDVLPISAAFCGFVVANAFALKYNALGMNQLMKVLITPCVLFIQAVVYRVSLPRAQFWAVILTTAGVLLGTFTNFDLNFWGTVWGFTGVAFSSVYQIWVKTEQERLGCSAQQLLHYQAPVSAILLVVFIPLLEDVIGPAGVSHFPWFTTIATFWVFFSSTCAFLVNISVFLVIGSTSPLTFNILGISRLCAILMSGYLFLGDNLTAVSLLGIAMAIAGTAWYTHLKLKDSDPASVSQSKGAYAKVAEYGLEEGNELKVFVPIITSPSRGAYSKNG